MNLREQILKEHSKVNTETIVKWIGGSQKRLDELVGLLFDEDPKVVQRSAWPLSQVAMIHPELFPKHLEKLLKLTGEKGIHGAVNRNIARLLQYVEIPEKLHGQVMNACFEFVSSPTEAVAVKAFALTVLQNLSKKYPEILPELKTIIEDRWALETAAFHSRARKVLKYIGKSRSRPLKS